MNAKRSSESLKWIDHAFAYATPEEPTPTHPVTSVGDTNFESWYSETPQLSDSYNMKQNIRVAYWAGYEEAAALHEAIAAVPEPTFRCLETAYDGKLPAEPNPLATQIGGDHYRLCKIQPVEFIEANGLGFLEGNVIKYVTRHATKTGKADLEKAKHYIDLLINFRYPEGAK